MLGELFGLDYNDQRNRGVLPEEGVERLLNAFNTIPGVRAPVAIFVPDPNYKIFRRTIARRNRDDVILTQELHFGDIHLSSDSIPVQVKVFAEESAGNPRAGNAMLICPANTSDLPAIYGAFHEAGYGHKR